MIVEQRHIFEDEFLKLIDVSFAWNEARSSLMNEVLGRGGESVPTYLS